MKYSELLTDECNKTKNSNQSTIYDHVVKTFTVNYNALMITFTETPDGYVFTMNNEALAVGVRENGTFHLLHADKLIDFSNAMQAFVHLRSIYEPMDVKESTMELFTKPSRPIDNMSKYMDNAVLSNIPKEVFHANLPN